MNRRLSAMMARKVTAVACMFALCSTAAQAVDEMIIGEKTVEPGITFIFEGAVKDDVTPSAMHLSEDHTDVHIEARVNWATENTPRGTPAGGFIPYLTVTAEVENQRTGAVAFVDLLPHINLVDNFHYARNMSLPGSRDDKYRVTFRVLPPEHLGLHFDWRADHGPQLLEPATFEYADLDFAAIAEASRR